MHEGPGVDGVVGHGEGDPLQDVSQVEVDRGRPENDPKTTDVGRKPSTSLHSPRPGLRASPGPSGRAIWIDPDLPRVRGTLICPARPSQLAPSRPDEPW